jgi:hypothetical protein
MRFGGRIWPESPVRSRLWRCGIILPQPFPVTTAPTVTTATGTLHRHDPTLTVTTAPAIMAGLVPTIRGVADAFDQWAEAGCEGWSFDSVLPHFVRIEDDPDVATAARSLASRLSGSVDWRSDVLCQRKRINAGCGVGPASFR